MNAAPRRIGRIWLVAAALLLATPATAADVDFQKFLETLWPAAREQGVSRATFDAAIQGLEPDLSLPDLVIPGRVDRQPAQAEFVQTPAEYLKETYFDKLAAQGRTLAEQHRGLLAKVELRFGVPAPVILAIWARETDYGAAKLPYDAIRALATQAWLGRRKEQFREEFVLALKMLQDGHVRRENMRSSWGGALGQPQLIPSSFYKYAVDFDGDGRKDIWTSMPDVLGTIANHLVELGWQRGQRWAYEVRAPQGADCAVAQPEVKLKIGEWVRRGYAVASDRKPSGDELEIEASLLMPAGTYGPAFLTPANYFVLKDYNFSDLYVLFVGHLADRIAGARAFETPWQKIEQLKTSSLEQMQRELTRRGLYKDKIDGKAGMLTRAALGDYQKQNGLSLDCWPTQAVLDHMARSR
ncbi:MAG TPA: lytic murein transglycosylase [Xanthobacteraceae bacterium]|nr:lytic murein transglycosylase [Xanthobacteraceae bacterium]